MLELRPNCEWCDRDLLPASGEARICSHECTYCADCVKKVLHDVCPTCGGNFVPRPIRPEGVWREGKSLGLQHQPASTIRVHTQWSRAQVDGTVARLADTPHDKR